MDDYSAKVEGHIFLNISNHPSRGWSREQTAAAMNECVSIVDVKPPAVPPYASLDEVRVMSGAVLDSVPVGTTHAMVSTEYTLTFLLVGILQSRGIKCFNATTERQLRIDDGGVKHTVFRFERFREYPGISLKEDQELC